MAPPPGLRIQPFPNQFSYMRLRVLEFTRRPLSNDNPGYLHFALALCCRYWEYRDNNVLLTTGLIRRRYRLRRFARNMDAAFTSRNVTHFIRGSKYWRLSSNRNRWNSPRTIRSRRLRNADAATTWINNNRIYVFKGDSYYRLGKVNRGERYPQSIATRWMRCDGGVGTTEP